MNYDNKKDDDLLIDAITTDIVGYLDEYDIEISHKSLFDSVDNIVNLFMQSSGSTREKALGVLKDFRETIGKDVAEQLLLSIAEERPGTDPYSHERKIPIPVSFAAVLSNTLATMVNLALFNDNISRAQRCAGFLVEYTDKVATYSLMELTEGGVDASPIGEEGTRFLPGPYIFMPQPALAQISRMIAAFAESIESRESQIPFNDPQVEEDSLQAYAVNFGKQVLLLDILRKRFGSPTDPSVES